MKAIRMARRPTPQEPTPANLSVDQMRTGIERIQRRITELSQFEASSLLKRSDPKVIALEASIEETLQRVFGAETLEMRRYRIAATLHQRIVAMSSGFGGSSSGPSPARVQKEFNELRVRSLALLEQAVRGLKEEIDEHRQFTAPQIEEPVAASTREVFIVHGHDDGAREAVARFLEKIGFKPIILHEQSNQGRTIIEKVEAHGDVGFAVVLLTPDDEGCKRGGSPSPRARQNVILELGYFIGRLGRQHVLALKRDDLEIPSDFGGVVYETFDAGGSWKQAVGRELQDAGFEIDWNKVMAR